MIVATGPALVTGATGFIGRRLLREGDRALVRSFAAAPCEVQATLEDPASLRVACQGVGTVFHCAGYAHAFASSDPDAHWRINYQGTANLLNAAGMVGVRSFVFLSSVKAMAEPGDQCIDEDWLGEPVTPYGIAKRAAETAVLEAGAKYGMHVVNLRLAMVYGAGGRGNLERMARGVRAGWFPRLPETGNRRSLVHVDDVVAAIRTVAENPAANGRTYIIAHPTPHSGRELYDAIRGALVIASEAKQSHDRHVPAALAMTHPPGPRASLRAQRSNPPPWSVPAWFLRTGGRAGDLLGRLARRPLPVNSEIVSRLLDSACYSPARIERELGWRASIDLASGLKEMLVQRG